MIRRCVCVLPAFVVLAALIALPAMADDKSEKKSSDCGTITKTICVPEYTTEKRMVERCEYKNEQRTKEVRVYEAKHKARTGVIAATERQLSTA